MSGARSFPSRVDAWLAVLVASSMGITLVASGLSFIPGPLAVAATLMAVCLLISGFILVLFTTTRYIVDDEAVLVRSGPLKWRIPLRDITEVRPTMNPLSSPALSLHRLDVRYGGSKSLLISPKDRPGFLAELAAREPGLTIEGDRIERRSASDAP